MVYENEEGYLQALEYIRNSGEIRETRNATTLSTFGIQLKFDIRSSFPLLTTKRVFWKGVLHELLWFLRGHTDAQELAQNNVHIWDGNSSRDFLDSRGLSHYQEGDCGPIYGYQWRHFNAPYTGCHNPSPGHPRPGVDPSPRHPPQGVDPSPRHPRPGVDPSPRHPPQGVDQLQHCIDLIRTDPTSRRIFMSAWNPCQLNEMCLPPCHVSYQFYVNRNNELSCMMYQRSGDMFLGVPFNIASTAFLVSILAHMTGKIPGSVCVCIGDAHIYQSHLDAVVEQVSRDPLVYSPPTLRILCDPKEKIEDYVFEDFEIDDYVSHPSIRAAMIA
jgi:thymidylate synthase